jgi:hypothetical protein
MKFIISLAKQDRLRHYERPEPWRRIRVALEEAHMSRDDMPFIETAAASKSKVLVANDDDYSQQVRQILRRQAKIRVLSETQACECLGHEAPGSHS